MPKLYCIFAREAERAVIFRRGPTDQVRLIAWNIKDHTFEPGQWFKGRIYERKSDLSPNGEKLVYFAAVHREPMPSWVAISSPPFLTAQVLWPKNGTYDGPSLFETDHVLGLGVYGRDPAYLCPRPGDVVPAVLKVVARPYLGYFYRREDHDRMIRDGWRVKSGEPKYKVSGQTDLLVYQKQIDQNYQLEMMVDCTIYHRTTYNLRAGDKGAIGLKADWADVRDGILYFSQGAKLLSIGPSDIGKSAKTAATLADFTDMKFEEIIAPDWATRW